MYSLTLELAELLQALQKSQVWKIYKQFPLLITNLNRSRNKIRYKRSSRRRRRLDRRRRKEKEIEKKEVREKDTLNTYES